MDKYNPEHEPDGEAWNALDELEQLALVSAYHKRAKARLPNLRLHSVIHVITENQLNEPIPTVRDTLERLMTEGLIF